MNILNKKIYKSLLILVGLVLIPINLKAQNEGEIAGGLIAIGAGAVEVEQMTESAELTATQWVLANQPEMTRFELNTIDFDGKKLKDMSTVSVISFTKQEFESADNRELNGKKKVLFAFTSQGWINEYGINFDKIKCFLIDADEWMNMMIAYVKVASSEKMKLLYNEKSLSFFL